MRDPQRRSLRLARSAARPSSASAPPTAADAPVRPPTAHPPPSHPPLSPEPPTPFPAPPEPPAPTRPTPLESPQGGGHEGVLRPLGAKSVDESGTCAREAPTLRSFERAARGSSAYIRVTHSDALGMDSSSACMSSAHAWTAPCPLSSPYPLLIGSSWASDSRSPRTVNGDVGWLVSTSQLCPEVAS
jgi:hypothetical protein